MTFDNIHEVEKTNCELSDNIEDRYFNEFILELLENLDILERDLALLKNDNSKKQIINRIFRKIHTINGLAGFVSHNIIEELSHKTEDLLNQVRKGEMSANASIILIVYQACELIRDLCKNKTRSFSDVLKNELIEFYEKLELINNGITPFFPENVSCNNKINHRISSSRF